MGTTVLLLVCGVLVSSTLAKPLVSEVSTTSTSTTQKDSVTPSRTTEGILQVSQKEIQPQQQENERPLEISTEIKQISEEAKLPEQIQSDFVPELMPPQEEPMPEQEEELPPVEGEGGEMVPVQESRFEETIAQEEIQEENPEEEEAQPSDANKFSVVPVDQEEPSRTFPFPDAEYQPEGEGGAPPPEEMMQKEAEMELPQVDDEPTLMNSEPMPSEAAQDEQQPQMEELPIRPEDEEAVEPSNEPGPPIPEQETPPQETYEDRIRNAMKESDEEALRSWGANSNVVEFDAPPNQYSFFQEPLFYKN